MTSCTLPNNGGTTTFTYGADGLRRSKTTNGNTTNFVYDNSMLIREMQTNPTAGQLQPSTTYFQGPQGPAYALSGQPNSMPSWYCDNGLGSVVAQIDPNGNVQASGNYDAYGGFPLSVGQSQMQPMSLLVGQ